METKIEKVLKILEEEIVAAEGCTEPIALSYAAAKAKRILGSVPNKVDVFLSGNIIKNVKSVTIWNSNMRNRRKRRSRRCPKRISSRS